MTMSNHPLYQKLFSEKTANDLLTRREAAEYLGVCENTLAIWACKKRYRLKYVKMGSLAKYKKEDLDNFIKQQTIDHENN
jgi:excisionase family DNA binding protein